MIKEKLIEHLISNKNLYRVGCSSFESNMNYTDSINFVLKNNKNHVYQHGLDLEMSSILNMDINDYIGIIIKYNKSNNTVFTMFCSCDSDEIVHKYSDIFNKDDLEYLLIKLDLESF